MSGTVFLPCWLVGLSFPTLDPKGCIGRDWALVSMNTPQHPCHQCPCPHSELQVPLASPGDPPRPAGRSGPGSYEVTPFPTGSQGTWDLCALWEWHLFPPVLWQSCDQALLAFKAKCSGVSSPWCQTPPPEEPDMGLELTPGRTSVILLFSSFWVIHPCGHPSIRVQGLITLWVHPFCNLVVASSLSLEVEHLYWWVLVLVCWWLFSIQLWFWCFRERRWAQVLLFHHLVRKSRSCWFLNSAFC